MKPGEFASKVRLTGLILGTDMRGETTTSCAEQDNPGEGLDSAAWCHVFLALGVLQTEGGCEGCGQSVSVVARRWQPRALGRAVGSEGAKHQDAAGLDGTRCRGDRPLARVGPDQCSGLPTSRYDADTLAAAFAPAFSLEHSEREEHVTPGGAVQPFTWVVLLRT